MMSPHLTRMSDGSLRFTELAPWFVGVIVQLPDLLDSNQPEEVSRRLYPDPSSSEEIQKEWDKYVRPELFALVASAREIVLKDIGNLRIEAGEASVLDGIEMPDGMDEMDVDEDDVEIALSGALAMGRLDIPVAHVQAWISALNIARLTLSTRFTVADDDMGDLDPEEEEDDEVLFSPKRIAVAQIHLLGFLQQMMIEEENPPPSDFEAPWSGEPQE